ncbi:unnamed protein product [Paramecium sonneborni]|uniref:Uncharacterized protein n=1 Tax=Paramecium sonneborni TaxID=65129 RepID=A0A8S1RNZ7_9CILI|nr:unnamed protein product [Paramecium sonneborni]
MTFQIIQYLLNEGTTYISTQKMLFKLLYKIKNSLTLTTSQDSGVLYIAAQDSDNEDLLVILAYKPRQPLRDSLVRVLTSKKQTSFIFDTQLAAAGFKQLIFFQNDGVKHNMGWIDKNFYYQIIPIYQTNQWVNKFRLNLTMWNLKLNPSVTLSQAIVLYQTKTQIKIFNNTQDVLIDEWKKSGFALVMKGTIVDYLIKCQQCGYRKNIDLLQPLRLQDLQNVVDYFVLQDQINSDQFQYLQIMNIFVKILLHTKYSGLGQGGYPYFWHQQQKESLEFTILFQLQFRPFYYLI